jgi:hypothetical protein
MKLIISNLKLGESVEGTVSEVLPGGDLLISFGGDLLKVHNDTPKRFAPGQPVTALVTAIRPLRFQLIEQRADQRRKGKLNLSI